jgi:hypothetical protein
MVISKKNRERNSEQGCFTRYLTAAGKCQPKPVKTTVAFTYLSTSHQPQGIAWGKLDMLYETCERALTTQAPNSPSGKIADQRNR